ncbi:MAG: 50S ribosomal protein L9 [Rhizobiaceae bacterium]|nr:50S ribosomal protein L9 [Rhizobiaceae bacterium]
MDVILLERIARLGQMGDTVTVKDGYARNFLLPQGKALRANKANMAHFESQRVHLEARNLERKNEAAEVSEKLNGNTYVAVRSAGETGQLYGSVAARDIVSTLEENGYSIGRSQVELRAPIKVIGLHTVLIALHPEVEAEIVMNVARSDDEAVRQAAGEDLTSRDAFEGDDVAEEDELSIEDIFENPEDADLGELIEDGEASAEDSASDEAAEEESGDDAAEGAGEETADESAEEEKAS